MHSWRIVGQPETAFEESTDDVLEADLNEAGFDPLRTDLPCSGMDLLFQLLQPRSSRSFFATACFGTATARCCALPHSLGTTPRHSFPRLNLHNDRVRRNHGLLGGVATVGVRRAET